MTHRAELETLATKLGATIHHDQEGRISRITLGGKTYGDGCLFSLVCFAEMARAR